MGIITPYSAQVRLLQDVVSTSRRSAAAAAAMEPRKDGEWACEDEGGTYYTRGDGSSGGGAGAGGAGRKGRGNKRGGIALPEIASVDGYQGREKEVRGATTFFFCRFGFFFRCFFLPVWSRAPVFVSVH